MSETGPKHPSLPTPVASLRLPQHRPLATRSLFAASKASGQARELSEAIRAATHAPFLSLPASDAAKVTVLERSLRQLELQLAERERVLAANEARLAERERDLAEAEALLIARERLAFAARRPSATI
jgi:hypothetical protein